MKSILLILFLIPLTCQAQSSLEKAKAQYENKKYEESKKLLTAIPSQDKDYASARYYLGRISFDTNLFDDAVDYFEEAIEIETKVADYYNWLGNAYANIVKDANVIRQGFLAPKMKNAWETAIALDPKNIDARQSLIEYYVQAPGFMGGSVEKAKEVANQIIKLNAGLGHRSMGNIFYREKDFVAAEKEYLEMVKGDEQFAPGLGNFYINQKQYSKAFALYEEQLKKHPSEMNIVYQIGKASALSGQQLDKGEKCLRQYLAYQPKPNEPSHAGANMRLAQIYEFRGNKSEAKKLYEGALKQDNTLKEAQDGLQRVSK